MKKNSTEYILADLQYKAVTKRQKGQKNATHAVTIKAMEKEFDKRYRDDYTG